MAFDHTDTDGLYDGQIEPVLRRNGVIPIIVNRRQSNDDLNNQIINELLKCDFCIADLTYTRPSVYFEAGFAQRSVEVIYTARKDHLNRGAPDDRRVHFDLQMKPLIPWSTVTDRTFGTLLEKRLRATVLRDWRSKQRAQDVKERGEQQFASLPVSERLVAIRRKPIAMFHALGFRGWTCDDRTRVVKPRNILAGRVNYSKATRVKGTTFEIVSVQSFDTVTKGNLDGLQFLYSPGSLETLRPTDDRRIRRFRAFHLILCLQPIPTSRVESVFRNLGRGLKAGHFVGSETRTPFWHRADTRVVEFVQDWSFIGPLRSQRELIERLVEIRARVGEK